MIINSDENKEGDGYIWVQCSYKPWLQTVCTINIRAGRYTGIIPFRRYLNAYRGMISDYL